ncbi:MAG: DUF1611 domain-containing protein [Candidatus Eisenbacteria bacterium]|nr:DUF1611 domain-containing protein [Candidatus Eisenbacteria bacterium]
MRQPRDSARKDFPIPFAVLAEGQFGLLESKTAACVIRYREKDVACVIDSSRAGQDAGDVLGFGKGIPVVSSIEDAIKFGPRSLLIGIAPKGGRLPDVFRVIVRKAMLAGLSIVSGLHTFLAEDDELVEIAGKTGVRLFDIRKVPDDLSVPTGRRKEIGAAVVLTVGSDSNTGKMTVAYELNREARRAGLRSYFAATGQTGILLSGSGIAVDRVICDFLAGACERLLLSVPDDAELIIVEGQGSLFHPAFSGVAVGLLHGTMPDGMILCHQPTRKEIRAYSVPIPPLKRQIQMHEDVASYLRESKVLGIALNCFDLDPSQTKKAVEEAERETGLPAFDAIKEGSGRVMASLARLVEDCRRRKNEAHV